MAAVHHLGDMLHAMAETFAEAIAAAPCVLFIDEIDAAGSREAKDTQNGNYRRQVINGFLEQVDMARDAARADHEAKRGSKRPQNRAAFQSSSEDK